MVLFSNVHTRICYVCNTTVPLGSANWKEAVSIA